ncbi:hypothetical protein Tco_1269448 [Tanacetum coccineum]
MKNQTVGHHLYTPYQEEVKTQLPQILLQAVSDFATPVIEKNVTKSLEVAVLEKSSSQPKSTYEAAASLFEFELTKILMDKMEKYKSYERVDYKRELYDVLVKSYETDKDLLYIMSAYVEEPSHIVDDSGVQQNQEFNMGHTSYVQHVSSAALKHDGNQYLFDLSKPLSLIEVQGCQVVPANYFINNDLGYLKGGSLSKKYITSTTKTWAAKYNNLEGIEDMVPTLWSPLRLHMTNMPFGEFCDRVRNDKSSMDSQDT